MRVVEEARRVEQQVRERTADAKRQYARFVTNFRALVERELGEVERLEAFIEAIEPTQPEIPFKRQA